MREVSIIIPWRDSGCAYRQANLSAVFAHLMDYAEERGYWVVLGEDGKESGPFNRSRAYNDGMEQAPAQTYVFHEADMLIDWEQLDRAIERARYTNGLIVPFSEYHYLTQEESREVISGLRKPEECTPQWVMGNGTAVGAVGVVNQLSMTRVGQWDEKFEGHGYDDRAMFTAFNVACGEATFIEGPGRHLWHPMAYAPWESGKHADPANYSPEEVEATRRNKARMSQYRSASTAERIRELTGGA